MLYAPKGVDDVVRASIAYVSKGFVGILRMSRQHRVPEGVVVLLLDVLALSDVLRELWLCYLDVLATSYILYTKT